MEHPAGFSTPGRPVLHIDASAADFDINVARQARQRLINMPKLLIGAGVVLILVGFAWMVGERFGLGRLPGDIVIERGNFRVYFPIATSLILSVVLSLVFWIFNR